jgi:predicted anti-sigma-YlaC factor YlaD
MDHCPDYLTIQALIDGEENDQALLKHLQDCFACRLQYRQLSSMVKLADGLKCEAKLPANFYHAMERKLTPAPFPTALVSLAVLLLVLASLLLLGPTYFEWWLSVGITSQVSLVLDALLDLFAISRLVSSSWVISGLAALVTMELFILKMLKNVEGWQNGW